MPAIIAGWLLAFTLSWDDVVIIVRLRPGLEHAADGDFPRRASA
jgi:hypothetical protein